MLKYFIFNYQKVVNCPQVLKREQQRCQQIFDSYNCRHLAISGGCAMAAAFSTYLGPYHHSFRHTMLTVHWPECLRERGTPLVVDSVDSLKGICVRLKL